MENNFGVRIQNYGVNICFHYILMIVRVYIVVYSIIMVAARICWILVDTFAIIFANAYTYNKETGYDFIQSNSVYNMILCWILWLFIIIQLFDAIRTYWVDIVCYLFCTIIAGFRRNQSIG